MNYMKAIFFQSYKQIVILHHKVGINSLNLHMNINQQMKSNQDISREEALHLAAAWCSSTERCSTEIADKLHNKGLAEQDIAGIISYLIKEKYIDDSRYARAFIKDKFRYNQWGRIKIRYMLMQKKIPREIIDSAFDVLDEDAYQDMIQKLISLKSKGLKAKDDYDKKMKLARFLAGKGFEYEAFSGVLNMHKENFDNG